MKSWLVRFSYREPYAQGYVCDQIEIYDRPLLLYCDKASLRLDSDVYIWKAGFIFLFRTDAFRQAGECHIEMSKWRRISKIENIYKMTKEALHENGTEIESLRNPLILLTLSKRNKLAIRYCAHYLF